ncbi:MAG: GNAT family N-acetyltransferase [Xanthobacter sp.]
MDISICPAELGDVEDIFTIRTSVQENHMSRAELEQIGITPRALMQMLSPRMADEPAIWIARMEGQAVGFSMVEQEDACLFALFVAPQCEGRGVGRALLERAEAALFQHHPRIWLETAVSSRACGFYRHLGWCISAHLDGDDVRMEKTGPRPAA